jgi:DNA-binding IclR family transcriptional regulator
VAAAIRNHRGSIVASLSISGPSQRVTDENITVFADLAMSAASRISARLGFVEGAHSTVFQPSGENRRSL